jgi:hypothetical protein
VSYVDVSLALKISERKEFSVESMADGICRAFCGPRGLSQGLSPVQQDLHRQQHLVIAREIFEQSGEPK